MLSTNDNKMDFVFNTCYFFYAFYGVSYPCSSDHRPDNEDLRCRLYCLCITNLFPPSVALIISLRRTHGCKMLSNNPHFIE